MEFLMNGLLLAATCFAGTYCWVLARRVRDLKSLDKGLGGAIVTLTRQVELARATLDEARNSSRDTKLELSKMVQQADTAANHLRLLIAAAPHAAPVRPAPEPAAAMAEPLAAVRRDPLLTAVAPEVETPAAAQIRLAPRPRPVVPPTISPEGEADPEPRGAPATPSLVIPSLDRLGAGPATRSRQSEPLEPIRPTAPHLAEVPKPRALAPIENPLRRLRAAKRGAPADVSAPAAKSGDSEDALLEALSALAGGR